MIYTIPKDSELQELEYSWNPYMAALINLSKELGLVYEPSGPYVEFAGLRIPSWIYFYPPRRKNVNSFAYCIAYHVSNGMFKTHAIPVLRGTEIALSGFVTTADAVNDTAFNFNNIDFDIRDMNLPKLKAQMVRMLDEIDKLLCQIEKDGIKQSESELLDVLTQE